MKLFKQIMAVLLTCLFLALPLAGCGESENETVIGTCGSYDVLYEELRFITMTYKQILDKTYGDGNTENGTIWDDSVTAEAHRAELEEKVWAMMSDNYKVLMQCEAYGYDSNALFGDEIQNAVTQQLNEEIENIGGEDSFREEMDAIFMTENLYRLYLARDIIKYKLRDAIVTSADKPEDMITDQTAFHEWLLEGNCVYVQHVMLRNDEGEDAAANRLLASEISTKLRLKEIKIENYIGQSLNDDLTTLAPYYIIPGLYDEALVEAALELTRDRDASDAVEVGDCYYVLQRIEEPEGTLEGQISTLFDNYLWAKIGEQTNQSASKPSIVLNEYGQNIDLLEIR